MSDLVTRLAWCAVQVSLLSVAAALLSALAQRRGPWVAGPIAFAGLAGCIVLTLLAVCPVSPWPAWIPPAKRNLAPGSEHAREASGASVPSARGSGKIGGSPLGLSLPPWGAANDLDRNHAGAETMNWSMLATILVLAGVAVGIGRLLLGLWTLRACLRHSQAVLDPQLNALMASLARCAGHQRPITIRQTAEMATPATIGWLRPVILLPADWREWSQTEQCAALAHELAHVHRRDYAVGILARLAVALHWYHPLLHWLAGVLRLQQEMAADTLAARCMGGRACYLAALARLALKTDGRPTSWPVAAMFSKPGTLMRRIAMLRSKEGCWRMQLRRRTRVLAASLLTLCAVGLSALRGPAGTPASPAPATGAATTALEPFDLTYLGSDSKTVLAVRPAALLSRPGLAPYRAVCDEAVGDICKMFGSSGRIQLAAHDIDQILASGLVSVDKHHKQKKGSRSLMFALRMVRCTHDFDWKGQMKKQMPDVVEVHHAGGTFFCLPASKAHAPLHGGLTYWIPDGRTIVLDTEENLRRMIEHKHVPSPAWADGWKKVEQDLLAMAIDSRSLDLPALFDAKDAHEAAGANILQSSTWIALGLCDTPGCAIDIYAECSKPENARKLHDGVAGLMELGKQSLSGATAAHTKDAQALTLARGLLATASLQCQGSRVEVHWRASEGFEEGLKAVMGVELDGSGKPVPRKQ